MVAGKPAVGAVLLAKKAAKHALLHAFAASPSLSGGADSGMNRRF